MPRTYTITRRIFIRMTPIIGFFANILGRDFYTNLYGRKFYYSLNTDIGQKLLRVGTFERAEISIIERILKEDSVSIDIGANIGTHSLFMAKISPKGKVFAFEPSRETYRLLLKNSEGVHNLFPANLAISNKCGFATFYKASDNAYSGLKDTQIKPIIGAENVLTTQLDKFISLFNLKKIDFVKIDVEGFDDEVIEGALSTFSIYKPIVLVEISEGKNLNPNPAKTIERMTQLGYEVFMVKGWEVVPFTKHSNIYYNYLFVPKGVQIPKRNNHESF